MLSPSNPPCAACKTQRKKCTEDCVFAPYFPANDLQKFTNVHKVFGASNVGKMLSNLDEAQRRDAVESLVYEAEARVRDPVYGCAGIVSALQQQMEQLQIELLDARKQLAGYNSGPKALVPILQPPARLSNVNQISLHPNHMMGFNQLNGRGSGGGGYQGGASTSGPHMPQVSLYGRTVMQQRSIRVTMMTRNPS